MLIVEEANVNALTFDVFSTKSETCCTPIFTIQLDSVNIKKTPLLLLLVSFNDFE